MAADSVAVNQPSRMPPTMMNGVKSAGSDSQPETKNSFSVARG
jgi:hypothetical protein